VKRDHNPRLEPKESTRLAVRRVIIADDDDDLRDLIVHRLLSDGYRVLETDSGHGLIDLLRDAQRTGRLPDVVVSDIQMPDVSGIEVLRRLHDRGFDSPVILMTAHRDDAVLDAAAEHGATAVLYKPFELDDLRTAVRFLSSKDRAERRQAPGFVPSPEADPKATFSDIARTEEDGDHDGFSPIRRRSGAAEH
jgi:CheY-like chemotaxis protein